MSTSTAGSKRKRRRGITDRQLKYLFLMPCILLLAFLIMYPLIWSAYLSFTDYRAIQGRFRLFPGLVEEKPGIKQIKPNFVGFQNYKRILRDGYIWEHYRTMGMFWNYMLEPNWGVIDYLLNAILKLPKIEWLSNPSTALYGVIIADTWMWSPFMFLFCLAGITAIPKYLYEAAEVNKASGWFRFSHITFPLMWPLMLIAIIFRTMDAFKLFDIGWGMTQGGPGYSSQTISMLLFRDAFMSSKTGISCAFAYIMLIMIVALSNIYIRYLLRARER